MAKSPRIKDKRLLALDLGALIAGQIRGEFEERKSSLLIQARSQIILFIDELHNYGRCRKVEAQWMRQHAETCACA